MKEAPFDPRAFTVPVLKGLSPSVQARIAGAGKTVHMEAGQCVFNEGDGSDDVFVLIYGNIELIATPRGHDQPRVLRAVGPGEAFGEEALLGFPRRAQARAITMVVFVSIPSPLFRRAVASATDGVKEAELARVARRLQRGATRDILRSGLFFGALPSDDFAMALDGAMHLEARRSEPIYRAGDASDFFYLVVEGLVQIQDEDGDHTTIAAYLSAGDFFGEDDIVAARVRKRSAVAMGRCHLIAIPSQLFRTLADRNSRQLRELQRTSIAQRQAQQQIVAEVAPSNDPGSTRHVFADLYRMQMASSLLTIDQDLCVRCGHCTWTCNKVHGVARIVRRGDKTLARLDVQGRDEGIRSLMLPNSCQHCVNPVCMIDCPTAAIGRDPQGEVFIREELCTGCSNCAKACPWDNIQMAPRPKSSPIAPSLLPNNATRGNAATTATVNNEVAVKCDLCRDYAAPACVSACPTEALLRLSPSTDFRDVASLIGNAGRPQRSVAERANRLWPLVVAVLAIGIAWRLSGSGVLSSAGSVGLWAGIAGVVGMLLAITYVAQKRMPRLWLRKKSPKAAAKGDDLARSKVRRFLNLHVAVGLLACGAVGVHTQMRIPDNTAGAAALTFWATALFGVLSLWVYRGLPRRLTRLERKGLLPEDFPAERERLRERLARTLQALDGRVQAVAKPLIASYVGAPLAGMGLVLSGRTLRAEEGRLRDKVAKRVPPAVSGTQANVDEAIRTAVAIRALPARAWLMRLLRLWLPIHIVLTAVLVALVGVHVALAVRWWL